MLTAAAAVQLPGNVLVTVGAAEANAITVASLIWPGDEVVVMEPGYRQVHASCSPFAPLFSLMHQPHASASVQPWLRCAAYHALSRISLCAALLELCCRPVSVMHQPLCSPG
jgi:hypothetical protein